MDKPTPEQAIKILDDATQPGVKLSRMDYVIVQMALEILAQMVQEAGQRMSTDDNGSTDKETMEKKL